jgi:teichuronic acid biosynthesis glycosyltransferase TuaG
VSNNLVSIILPTYNQGSYLRRAILSVINQSYKNWELIIVDNYSSDQTESIVKEFHVKNIKYFKFKN